MDIFSLLSALGGLALFLFGMEFLGENLSKASGGRLEHTLEKLTASQPKAVILGAVATAVIQSSSATTVMVVGFVNSGIMKLYQAAGIIMGANIGTTATSWILSLSGIESENFFIQLLKPSSFSPVFALTGVFMYMFAKGQRNKMIGGILLGFSMLMIGMDTMSGALSGLSQVPEFSQIMLMFTNPVFGMMAGMILTALIQSSSASMGILQAFCASGMITYGTALPLILGQNIGTCVTAMLSAAGASKNARRAAFIHLYFNLIGTVVFMVVFYAVNFIVGFSFLDEKASLVGIAFFHSGFNIGATLLLLPFVKKLEWLARKTVRDKDLMEETDKSNIYPMRGQ